MHGPMDIERQTKTVFHQVFAPQNLYLNCW